MVSRRGRDLCFQHSRHVIMCVLNNVFTKMKKILKKCSPSIHGILVTIVLTLFCYSIYAWNVGYPDPNKGRAEYERELLEKNKGFLPQHTVPDVQAAHLKSMCKTLHSFGQVPINFPSHSYQYLYVNDEYKFIFSMMPKLACTNWKRVFLSLNNRFKDKDYVMNKMPGDDVHNLFAKYGSVLSRYNQSEIQYRLHTYKKVIFVRNPFERLLSAFKDKMFRNDSQWFLSIADKVKRKKGSIYNSKVTFLEFVKYLTDPDTFEEAYEQHWATYSHLCHPCLVNYDFIGKFETMEKDIEHAFKYMGISNVALFPKRHESYKNTKSSILLEKYYKQLPREYLQKLYTMYKSDFLLFSYSLPPDIRNLL